MTPDNLILALDLDDPKAALQWIDRLKHKIGTFKIGMQLFNLTGPDFIKEIRLRDANVFLDLKFHDIPNTVGRAIESICKLDVSFVTIHTMGGRQMMSEAMKAASAFPRTTVLGVTVLTHHSEEDLVEIGFNHTPQGQVLELARLAHSAELKGLVCSPLEVSLIRREFSDHFTLVTPGVRPKGSDLNDQSRVTTPAEAIELGSNYLVIGRPIMKAQNPEAVLDSILNSTTKKTN
ncbi:MAG: orotidine-5'-phosphate decarboxylase [Verrucomicrobiota bacterium]